MSASSSTTSGWRRVRTPGIPSKCWCGVGITELISKTNIAGIIGLENDNHVFKWVDEAFTDEIQKVRMLEEEVQFLKATIRSESELSEGPKIMEPKIKISGGCVILALVLVLGIMMYKK
ncbi:uncharacterized protein At4g04775-like [Brassica napus]|uniref:uncharacterized protein At4g04775-like n=1 Tax=Brassica napus TaxID=3708 RepID=UPI000BBF28E2|nr:uncharacterized protein At4g04775-like [Brassica napus]